MYSKLRSITTEFEKISKRLAKRIYLDSDESSILYFPFETGGREMGRPLEENFRRILKNRLKVYPVSRNRELGIITSPDKNVVIQDSLNLHEKYEYGVVAVGFDDVVATGRDMMILYDYLKNIQPQARFDNIILSAVIDKVGITDYCMINLATRHIDKDYYYRRWGKRRARSSYAELCVT